MKTVRMLDDTGDTRVDFSVKDSKATAEAQALFERIKKAGTAIQTKRPGGLPDEVITDFDKIEEGAEVILVRPIVAG
jgi:hypothetical protein